MDGRCRGSRHSHLVFRSGCALAVTSLQRRRHSDGMELMPTATSRRVPVRLLRSSPRIPVSAIVTLAVSGLISARFRSLLLVSPDRISHRFTFELLTAATLTYPSLR